jgi:anti-sigma factor RsiW
MTRKVELRMPHVDEGTLHALLDGELEPAEVQQVQTHFATCTACQSRLDEARHMMEETERLLKALEPQPARRSGSHTERLGADPPRAESPRATAPLPPLDEEPRPPLDPMVLIPDNPSITEVRRRRLRTAAWAAGILVAFGAGGFAVKAGMLADKPTGELRLRPEEFQAAAPSPQEARNSPVVPTSATATGAGAPAALPPAATPPPTASRDSGSGASAAQTPVPTPTPAPTAAPPVARVEAARTPPAGSGAEAGDSAPEPPSDVRPQASQRDKRTETSGKVASPPAAKDAGNVMRALDRQKAAEASNRALASMDAERRAREERAASRDTAVPTGNTARAADAAANDAPPPQPPTLEQRSQITSRIGLDEASHLLGGPLHAIDAADYTRQFVGIVSGASVPGADPNRPVVRAVYVDRSGRVLYLDQQRVRPGQAEDLPTTPPEGERDHRWVSGATLLRLHGDRSPASLDTLARRVR